MILYAVFVKPPFPGSCPITKNYPILWTPNEHHSCATAVAIHTQSPNGASRLRSGFGFRFGLKLGLGSGSGPRMPKREKYRTHAPKFSGETKYRKNRTDAPHQVSAHSQPLVPLRWGRGLGCSKGMPHKRPHPGDDEIGKGRKHQVSLVHTYQGISGARPIRNGGYGLVDSSLIRVTKYISLSLSKK